MDTTIAEARQQLDTLLADLEQREQSVAQAAELLQLVVNQLEQLSQEPAIAAAWQQGGMAERDRVLLLVDHQLDQLSRGGINALVLTALRRQVLEVEA